MYQANSGPADLYNTTYPDWFIEPFKPLQSWSGATSDGKHVWTQIHAIDGSNYIIAFDAQSLLQAALFQIDNNVFPPRFGPASGGIRGAINATQWAQYGSIPGGFLAVRGFDGSQVVTGPLSTSRGTANGGAETVVALAPLDWPHAATTRLVMSHINPTFQFPSGANKYEYFEFIQCELGSGADGYFAWGNPTTVRHVDYDASIPLVDGFQHVFPQARWLGYDHSATSWAAGIFYETTLNTSPNSTFPNQYHNKLELIIGGQVVVLAADVVGAKTLIPHICYPHESLGDGFVAVMQSTVLTSALTTSEMVVYRNGAELWRTDTSGQISAILGSTDRWIYFQTAGDCTIPQVTKGEFSSSTGSQNTHGAFWIARHDGSQIIPLGIISDNFKQIQSLSTGGSGNLSSGATHDFCFTRDSSIIPNALPATYQEMYDQRTKT